MNRAALARILLAAGGLALLAACSGPDVPTAEQMNASYEQALERTAAGAAPLPADADAPGGALARAAAFFMDMRAQTVREQALAVYAPEAYLYDNIAFVEGAAAIGEYFAHAVGRVQSLQVQFLDVSHSGADYYVRWRMSVRSDRLNDGQPMVSYGVTHFRFDAAGRILLHRDFWDAGTGLHEYIPGVRGLLRRVRAAAEGG